MYELCHSDNVMKIRMKWANINGMFQVSSASWIIINDFAERRVE